MPGGLVVRTQNGGRSIPEHWDTRVCLVEEDPDLVRDVDPAEFDSMRAAAMAPTLALESGVLHGFADLPAPAFGFFVLNGLLTRGVVIQGRRSAELLGPGDVLRPRASEGYDSSVPFEVTWEALEPARIAVLDQDFADAVTQWPVLISALMDRVMRRAHSLGFHLAVSHLKLVEMRLLVILWYYADRWGRVTPDGVVLPLRMTHSLLARIVGARRPSVSTALGRLQERGLVDRTEAGHWVLRGQPPGDLEEWPAAEISGAAGAQGPARSDDA
jgi:CRP/FNR family cyclic AMP-dependent transcriptional regulator